ncbi:MAG TPA: zinc ribbon domain-containing protein [Dehalococcoidia bacterium]|nr:zinc ribbon domain-containing protein [Dehalococcoidia bacterium]
MPIYEYVCAKCNLRFELRRPLSEASQDSTCPQCHSRAKRLFSTFASFSTDKSGLTTPIAGSNPCASCSATSCDTCNP